jgi:hypothetical protein
MSSPIPNLQNIGFLATLVFQVVQFFQPTTEGRFAKALNRHRKDRKAYEKLSWKRVRDGALPTQAYELLMIGWDDRNPQPVIADFDPTEVPLSLNAPPSLVDYQARLLRNSEAGAKQKD